MTGHCWELPQFIGGPMLDFLGELSGEFGESAAGIPYGLVTNPQLLNMTRMARRHAR